MRRQWLYLGSYDNGVLFEGTEIDRAKAEGWTEHPDSEGKSGSEVVVETPEQPIVESLKRKRGRPPKMRVE